ncbi:hypothetical protein [Salinicoccus halodurans]|nr:hypothetical protein [Salinicoccus halodurans]SFK95019.1 hypothetical protein SAMN05216235_2705 [Salinicoccus halodurans]
MKQTYQPPEISGGDLRVPVTFYRQTANAGPIPGTGRTKVFFALCELYESSSKDLEYVASTTAEHTLTIVFRRPRSDYRIKNSDVFEVDDDLYAGVTFEVQHFAPTSDNKEMMKVVGAGNANDG